MFLQYTTNDNPEWDNRKTLEVFEVDTLFGNEVCVNSIYLVEELQHIDKNDFCQYPVSQFRDWNVVASI